MENVEFLKAVSLFSELPAGITSTIASKMQELTFERGRLICEENTPGNALFIIKSGIVQIYIGEGPDKKVLAYLKRGDYFGEMAIFTGDPRSASAQAIADVILLGVTKADFEAEVQRSPSIALELLKTLSRRLAKASISAGGVGDKTGRIIFLAGSQKGAGKTAVAREVARGLAQLSGGRVVLFDPNVQNAAVARSVGVKETCDLAKELVSSDHITVERYLAETPWGFSVLKPQKVEKTTYPLKESHHHILVNALADKFDYLVVDSSSTMASLNKHLMQAAARILVILSGQQESLTGFLDPFERMVLEVNQVDRRKLLYSLNVNGEGLEETAKKKLERWVNDVQRILPYDPEALNAADERGGPAAEVAPDTAWAKEARELVRDVYLDHSLEIFLPIASVDEPPKGKVAELADTIEGKFSELFTDTPEVERLEVEEHGEEDEPARNPALRIGVRVTESGMTEGMDAFLGLANQARDDLGLQALLVKVDGRPSLI